MNQIPKRGVVATLLIFAGCFTAFAQGSSPKSDKEREGLAGPVARVRIESTHFKRENGKLVESDRLLWAEYEYDRSGKLINSKKNPVFGDPKLCDQKFKYDEKGREKEKYCLDGSKEKVLERYAYEEDRYGNWTKKVTSVPDKSGETFHNKWVLYREIVYFD